jgi:hypothetical protein
MGDPVEGFHLVEMIKYGGGFVVVGIVVAVLTIHPSCIGNTTLGLRYWDCSVLGLTTQSATPEPPDWMNLVVVFVGAFAGLIVAALAGPSIRKMVGGERE